MWNACSTKCPLILFTAERGTSHQETLKKEQMHAKKSIWKI